MERETMNELTSSCKNGFMIIKFWTEHKNELVTEDSFLRQNILIALHGVGSWVRPDDCGTG